MPKGSKEAHQTYGQEMQDASGLRGKGDSSWNAMFPTLQQNATAPEGLNPGQMAKMNTANQQATGGSNAGLVGQGALDAGRTRNPGSMAAGLAQAARTAGANESKNALGIQEYSNNLAQQKQQAALGELGKLYGTNVGGLNEMLGNQNKSVSEITAADQAVMGNIMGGVKMAAGMGMGGAGMAGMGPGGGASAMNFGQSMMG